MGAVAYGAFLFLGKRLGENLSLLAAIGVGVITYAIIVYFLKIPEVDSTLKIVKRKIRGMI